MRTCHIMPFSKYSMLRSRSIGLVTVDTKYKSIQNNQLSRQLDTRTKSNVDTRNIAIPLYTIVSCNIDHLYTDGSVDTIYSECQQMTVLHAAIPFIILLTCGIITRMSLIKQSDNADALLQ